MTRIGFIDYLLNWRTARADDRLVEDNPPLPVIIMGARGPGNTAPTLINAADEVPTADATTRTNTQNAATFSESTRDYVVSSSPLTADASGAGVTVGLWTSILPQTVTADGAGLPPATALIALDAGSLIDVMIWMTVDTVAGANQYQFDFRTDPLAAVGGIAAVQPDWTAVIIPQPANGTTPHNTWGHRMITSVVSSAFGIAQGVNGDWPNAAQVTFYGFYRYI